MMSGTDVLKRIIHLEVSKQVYPDDFDLLQTVELQTYYKVLGRTLDFCEIQNVATRVGELQNEKSYQ